MTWNKQQPPSYTAVWTEPPAADDTWVPDQSEDTEWISRAQIDVADLIYNDAFNLRYDDFIIVTYTAPPEWENQLPVETIWD